jgi:GT2 family glycosyltransferase
MIDFEIIVVNYNTPDLMVTLINSIRKFVGNNEIRIIDGSSEEYLNEPNYRNLTINDKNIHHHKIGYNIHHGGGMNYGLMRCETKYALIVDSDLKFISKGYVEFIDNKIKKYDSFYGIGRVIKVNKDGEGVANGKIKYLHPNLMFLDVNEFKKNVKFINHGSPCIKTMVSLNGKNCLIDTTKEMEKFVNYGNRGTRKRFNIYM